MDVSRYWPKASFEGATVVKLHLANSKLREKNFSAKRLIWNGLKEPFYNDKKL